MELLNFGIARKPHTLRNKKFQAGYIVYYYLSYVHKVHFMSKPKAGIEITKAKTIKRKQF